MLYKLIALALFIPPMLRAQEAAYPAKADYYVNDYANIIDDKVQAELDAKLKEFDKQTTNEIVIATFPELKGNLEEVSNKLFRDWGIGKKETNNGVAFFIFLKDENGKGKTRIEVGKGLEGVIPDSKAKLLYEREIKPHLVKRDFTSGVTVAADKLMAYAKEELTGPPAPVESGDGPSVAVIFFVFMGLSAVALGFWKLLVPEEPETPTYTPEPTKKKSFSSSSSGSYGDYAPPREYERYSGVGSSYGPSYGDPPSGAKPKPKKSESSSSKRKRDSDDSPSSGWSAPSYSPPSYSSSSSPSPSSYDSGGGISDGGGAGGDF